MNPLQQDAQWLTLAGKSLAGRANRLPPTTAKAQHLYHAAAHAHRAAFHALAASRLTPKEPPCGHTAPESSTYTTGTQ